MGKIPAQTQTGNCPDQNVQNGIESQVNSRGCTGEVQIARNQPVAQGQAKFGRQYVGQKTSTKKNEVNQAGFMRFVRSKVNLPAQRLNEKVKKCHEENWCDPHRRNCCKSSARNVIGIPCNARQHQQYKDAKLHVEP